MPPPSLTIDQMRAYNAFVQNHVRTCTSAAPSAAEWLVFCGWNTDTGAQAAALLAANPQNADIRSVLDPLLRSTPPPHAPPPQAPPAAPHAPPAPPAAPQNVQNPRRRRRQAESEESDTEDADDEREDVESSRRRRPRKAHRGRKKAKIDRPLTKEGIELDDEQEETYDQLRVRCFHLHPHISS